MSRRGYKTMNEYSNAFPDYADTPKAVIAAICLSLARRLSDDSYGAACSLIRIEWDTLHVNDIIPQQRPHGRAQVSEHDTPKED